MRSRRDLWRIPALLAALAVWRKAASAQLAASRGYATPLVEKTLKSAAFSLGSTGTVVAGASGRRIKVYAVKLVAAASMSVNFRDGAGTNLEGAMALAANGGFVEFVNPPNFLFATSAGNGLDLVVSGAGSVAGRVSYWDDDNT